MSLKKQQDGNEVLKIHLFRLREVLLLDSVADPPYLAISFPGTIQFHNTAILQKYSRYRIVLGSFD